MLRVVAICAVAFGCHLIVAADSDITADKNLINETLVEETTTVQAEKQPKAVDEDNYKDIKDDNYPINETLVVETTTVEANGQPKAVDGDESYKDIKDDNYLINETLVEETTTVQAKRQAKAVDLDDGYKEENFCLQPPEIDGIISPILEAEEHPVGTIISYQCDFGYVSRSSGSLLSICRINKRSGKAEWTHPNTTCIPRSCGDPGYVVNGRRIGNLFTFPNNVQFECLEGYKRQGLKDRYCQANGEWSGKLPTCVQIRCPVPPNPANGRVRYSSLDYGSELKYECDKGFMLQNHQPRICSEDGIWSNNVPECIETTCEVPEAPDHGSMQLSDEPKVGTLAFYSCNEDTTLVGATTSKCLKTGEWTFNPPKCLRSCYAYAVQDGELGRYERINKYRQDYVPFQTGEPIKHNEVVSVVCKDGYVPGNGTSNQVICNDGTWSEILHCHSTLCNGEPPPTANAEPQISSRAHGKTIWYKCDPGYHKTKGGKVVCTYGQWKGYTPVCTDYRCHMKDLNYPGLVKPRMDFIQHGENFEIACTRAYTTSSWKQKASCFAGNWDITENPCIIKTCENDPPSLPNGTPRDFARINGSVVNYVCFENYEMVGNSSVLCAFGEWKGEPPICKSSIKNQVTTTTKEPKNKRTTEESLNHTVNSFQPEECFCKYNYRKDLLLAYLKNIEIDGHHRIKKGETVFLMCRYVGMDIIWPNGLRFLGNVELHCDECYNWQEHELPGCVPRVAGDSYILHNQQLKLKPGGIIEIPKGERASLTCINEWLKPEWYVRATENIRLDETYIAERRSYGNSITIDEMDYEHTGRYECFAIHGYERKGSAIIDLKISGLHISCPELSTETDEGSFEILYSDGRNVDSIAYYSCKDPLKRIVGPSERNCQENGRWSRLYPACADIRCPLLNENNIFRIKYSNENRQVNSLAFYDCRYTRQRLIGSSNRTCLHSGEWSGTNPVCEEVNCPRFSKYNGLSVSYSNGTKVGSIASFNCLNQATLHGSKTSRCLSSGMWSDPRPSCEHYVSCDLFSIPPNLKVRYTHDGRAGSVASFQCSPPTSLVGSSSSRCLSNGTWSHSLPICAAPNCSIENLAMSLPEFVYPDNVTSEFVTPGSKMPLICEDNLMLSGSSTVLCKFNGKWEIPDVKCVPACVVNKVETSHLIVHPVKDYYRIGEFILLSCPPGHKLTSQVERMMCLGKTWSDTLPDCTLSTLPEPSITGSTQTVTQSG